MAWSLITLEHVEGRSRPSHLGEDFFGLLIWMIATEPAVSTCLHSLLREHDDLLKALFTNMDTNMEHHIGRKSTRERRKFGPH